MSIAAIAIAAKWRDLPPMAPEAKPILMNCLWLVLLVLLSVPFSIWLVPSIKFLYQLLPPLVVSVLIVSKLSASWLSLKRLSLYFVAAGTLVAAHGLLTYGGGRLGGNGGLMYDPNDVAFALVITLPIAIAHFYGLMGWRRWALLTCCALLTIAILLTSSRGGFLGLMTFLILFLFAPPPLNRSAEAERQRHRNPNIFGAIRRFALILALLGGIFVVVWPRLPFETRTRLETVLNLQSDYNLDSNEDQGRTQIWKRGVNALEQRPWGYGAGSYVMVDYRSGGRMRAPHNSVLQISVELGVLGGALLLRMYWLLWRGLGRTKRVLITSSHSLREDFHKLVLCRMVQIGLISAFVSSFFLSMAYSPLLWLFFAIGIGAVQQGTTRRDSHQATSAVGR